jgi:predicted flap endonuclease-1-like 5' DNA nuclease
MMNMNDKTWCMVGSVGMAGIAGVMATVLSVMFAGIGWNGSVFIGVLVLAVLAVLFLALFCGDTTKVDPAKMKPREVGKATGPAASDKTTVTSAAAAMSSSSTSSSTEQKEKPASSTALSTTPDAKPITAASGGTAGPATKASAPPSKPAETKAANTTPAGIMATPAAADVTVTEEKPADLMTKPKGGSGDDLKLISGVGPKLEETLNELGIWHFDQVAKWGPKEIAWVDARLRFKGRIERDDWMSQAKTLAAGGETEFSRKKKS